MYLDDRQQAWGYEDSPSITTPVAEPFRAGRYVILQHVGHGAMGNVYAAYDPELDRKVAVKVLRDGGRPLPASLAREAKAMAKLTHAHVVAVHDVGTCDRGVFVAMEFVDGVTLRTWLKGQARPWRTILEVFRRAGEGLAAAHLAGVVHHDFKPDNVLVGGDGATVKVADFGLARVALGTAAAVSGELSDAGATRASGSVPSSGGRASGSGGTVTQASERGPVGTLAYMAPERHALRPADARSDQFSFCVALYEALYQQRPFAGGDVAALRQAVMHGEPAEPPRATPVPARVWAALKRGLARAPERRFASMSELLAALAEPRSLRWRWLMTAGLVVGGSAAMLAAQSSEDRCVGVTSEADAWWAEQDAPASEWFDGWRTRVHTTCVQGLSGRIAADLRLAREACLAQQLASVRALVAEAAAVPEQREALWRELPRASACDDEEVLLAVAPPAFAARGEVAAIREGLAAVAAAEVAGQYGAARERLVGLDERAAALGYAPLIAEALYQRGRLEHYSGEARAVDSLLAAIDEAEAVRHDRLAADAWGFLVEVAALTNRVEVAGWQRRAQAARRRLLAGSRSGAAAADDPRRVHPALARGLVALREGDRDAAAAAFREALAGEGLHPLTRAKLQLDLAIALGEGEAAEAAWTAALAAHEDPRVAAPHRGQAWIERGGSLFLYERYAEAGAAYARGVALLQASPADTPRRFTALRTAYRGIAIAEVTGFRLAAAGAAVAAAERAAADGKLPADPSLAEVAFEVHLLQGRADEARRIAGEALAQLREQGAPPAERALAHARLGEAMLWQSDDAAAGREFDAALTVLADAAPDDDDDTAAYAYKGLGLVALRAGDRRAASAALARASELWRRVPCGCRDAAEAELALALTRSQGERVGGDDFFTAHGDAAVSHRDRFVRWIGEGNKGRPQ
ncbi:MAG: serine/threonine protein kinase [Myxococcales bacterium]|nr:serine/threonine protein kinase [Myxococcales bacterium]